LVTRFDSTVFTRTYSTNEAANPELTRDKENFTSSDNQENSRRNEDSQKERRKKDLEDKNRNLGLSMVAVVVGTLGLSYAAVPLYRLFCEATGYGGTTQESKTVATLSERKKSIASSRPIKIYFNADTSDKMPWRFYPSQKEVTVVPGESTLAFYRAANLTDKAITGVSTYNVTPQKVLNPSVKR
jgi:cytochrome c oxidase assembly protein subunit 11